MLTLFSLGAPLPSIRSVRPGAAQGRGETCYDFRATSPRENDDKKNSGEEDHEGSRAVAVIFFLASESGLRVT